MKYLIICTILIVAVSCEPVETPVPAGPIYPATPPSEVDVDRPAAVYVPSDYSTETTYPLVIMLHGYSASGDLQNVVFQLKERVDEYQFVLVIPDGTENPIQRRFWNATDECCDFYNQKPDDVKYLLGLADQIAAQVPVDPNAIRFVGHSNGSYMAFRMACEHPERIHAVVSLAGSVHKDVADCAVQEPVNVLHIHGTEDETVPFWDSTTDTSREGGVEGIRTVGAVATVDRWRGFAGCPDAPTETESIDVASGIDGAETTRRRWDNCSSGHVVEFWEIEGGDHLVLDANNTFRDRVAAFLTGE